MSNDDETDAGFVLSRTRTLQDLMSELSNTAAVIGASQSITKLKRKTKTFFFYATFNFLLYI